MRRHIFVVPEEHSQISGGLLFNWHLIHALRTLGQVVEAATPERAVELLRNEQGIALWVDSLYSEAVPTLCSHRGYRQPLMLIVRSFEGGKPEISAADSLRMTRIENAAFQHADGYLIGSEWSRHMIEQRGFGHRPALLVPPALCLRPLPLVPPREIISPLMVANLARGKGLLEFLTQLSLRVQPADPLRLRVAGGTADEPDYAAACLALTQAGSRLHGKLEFLGPLDGDALRKAFAESSFFVSSSPRESFGMAMAEARAFGLPILARQGGNSAAHVTDGENGRLCASAEELAAECLAWTRNPDRLAALRSGAILHRQNDAYTWQGAGTLFLAQWELFEQSHELFMPRYSGRLK